MPGEIEIKRHADGTLYVRPYLGRNRVTGQAMQPYHRLSATDEREARAEARAWLGSILGNPPLEDALRDYVDGLEAMGRPANTVRSYRTYARAYVCPRIGRIRVRDLTVADLGALYRSLAGGGSKGGRRLSESTVLAVHWFLRGAYRQFVTDGIALENPALHVAKPSLIQPEAHALDGAELSVLEAELARMTSAAPESAREARDRNVAFLAQLALRCGLRCGEACALRRCDVSWERMDVRISATVTERHGARRQEKTKGRRSRNVSLTQADLRAIRAQVRFVDGFVADAGREAPLATMDGSFMRPAEVARRFREIALDLGLPPWVRFHTLRHTHATWLLAHGADLKTVSERLGHARPATTLSIYAHVLPGRDAAAAAMFADLMGGLDDGV